MQKDKNKTKKQKTIVSAKRLVRTIPKVVKSKTRMPGAKPKKRFTIVTDYLDKIYIPEKFEKTVNRSIKLLRSFKKTHPFEAIAFSGTSGAAIAYILGYKFKIPLISVRKISSNSHFMGTVEGCYSAKNYLIVDDFIETGATVEFIIDSISKETKSEPVGLFLYATHSKNKSFSHNKYKIPIVK